MIITKLPFTEVENYIKNKYANGTGKPRYYFRGQRMDYSSVKSSLSIVNGFSGTAEDKNTIRSQAHHICQLSYKIGGCMRGTIIMDEFDALALMQHYLWLSPMLDVTATVQVALYFAWLNSTANDESIIYIVDRELVPDAIHFCDHDFLIYDLANGGTRHRWLNQDGYGICLKDFHDLEGLVNFDFLDTGNMFVEAIKFIFPKNYHFTQDLMDEKDDPLPRHFQGVMRNVCEEIIGDKLHPFLKQRIDQICVGASNLKVTNFDEAFKTYLQYGQIFTLCFLEKALTFVRDRSNEADFNKCKRELRNIGKVKYWDTSVHASAHFILNFVKLHTESKDSSIFKAFEECYLQAQKNHFPDSNF